MTDLPYTYTDDDGVALRVGPRVCTAYDRPGRTSVGFYTPTGDEAVGLARAVLAAAGDTGHMVISRDELTAMRRADARSMRERAMRAASDAPGTPCTPTEAIRALPLLPSDGDTTEDQDAQLPDRNGDIIADIEIALTRQGDLSDEHHAFYSEIVHRFEALTSERDRYRTAWESARRDRAQLDDALRWGRILEAQRADLRQELRAAREVTGRLPETDMVEPGDEVPDLAELRALVERLALDQAEATKAVTQRLAVVETHLGITDEEHPAPTLYRDTTGDLWEERSDGLLTTIAVDPNRPRDLGITLTRAITERQYGPLTPVTTSDPSSPCEVCGRAPDAQEHGPDGRCRHTPATRLGRPTT